jgi:hypothetical protein
MKAASPAARAASPKNEGALQAIKASRASLEDASPKNRDSPRGPEDASPNFERALPANVTLWRRTKHAFRSSTTSFA